MIIKSLAHLKRVLQQGVMFEIVLHNRPEYIGQIRHVTKSSASSFYSAVAFDAHNKINEANNGFGLWCEYGPAKLWTFDSEGVCAKYSDYQFQPNETIMAFKIIGEAVQA